MLGLCANGHLTGQRRCGQCSADRGKPLRRDAVAREFETSFTLFGILVPGGFPPLKRDANGHNFYADVRRATRAPGPPVGRRVDVSNLTPPPPMVVGMHI